MNVFVYNILVLCITFILNSLKMITLVIFVKMLALSVFFFLLMPYTNAWFCFQYIKLFAWFFFNYCLLKTSEIFEAIHVFALGAQPYGTYEMHLACKSVEKNRTYENRKKVPLKKGVTLAYTRERFGHSSLEVSPRTDMQLWNLGLTVHLFVLSQLNSLNQTNLA